MPAILQIVSGVRSGTTVWIDRPVMRIGSHPDADVCVPSADIAEHAATLEYRAGAYIVYNRTPAAIRVGGDDLAPGTAGHWPNGSELDLGDGTRLRLELSGEGAPSAEPLQTDYDQEYGYEQQPELPEHNDLTAATESESAGDRSQLKVIGQVAVIVFCCLAVGLILFAQFVTPQSSQLPQASSIQDLLGSLATSIEQADSVEEQQQLRHLRRLLRQAEFLRLRGETNQARQSYALLRAELLRRREVLGATRSADEQTILKYVLVRLSQLPPDA